MKQLKPVRLLALFLAALAAVTLLASCASDEKVVTPSDYFYTYDSAGVLSVQTQTRAAELGKAISAKTGGDLVVVCVRTIGSMEPEQYAAAVFRQWKLTKDSFLLLLCLNRDDYCFTMGPALAKRLPAAKAEAILKEAFEPFFAAGAYDAAVSMIYERLAETYGTVYGVSVTAAAAKASGGGVKWFVILLIVAAIVAAVVWLSRRSSSGSPSRTRNTGYGGYTGAGTGGGYSSAPTSPGYSGYHDPVTTIPAPSSRRSSGKPTPERTYTYNSPSSGTYPRTGTSRPMNTGPYPRTGTSRPMNTGTYPRTGTSRPMNTGTYPRTGTSSGRSSGTPTRPSSLSRPIGGTRPISRTTSRPSSVTPSAPTRSASGGGGTTRGGGAGRR